MNGKRTRIGHLCKYSPWECQKTLYLAAGSPAWLSTLKRCTTGREMTLTLDSSQTEPLGDAPLPAAYRATRQDWKYCAILLAILLAMYLVLQNGLWSSGPDTAFYISVARDVALGRGLTFNGDPVGRAPPGWPLVLAAAMKISPTFRFINLVPMVLILASMGMWFFIIRRLADTSKTFW